MGGVKEDQPHWVKSNKMFSLWILSLI